MVVEPDVRAGRAGAVELARVAAHAPVCQALRARPRAVAGLSLLPSIITERRSINVVYRFNLTYNNFYMHFLTVTVVKGNLKL